MLASPHPRVHMSFQVLPGVILLLNPVAVLKSAVKLCKKPLFVPQHTTALHSPAAAQRA